MTRFLIILIIVTLLAGGIFVLGVNAGRSRTTQPLLAQIDSLANGWTSARAEIVSQKELARRLGETASTLDARWRKAAGESARLRLELDKLTGSGPGELPDPGQPPTLARYEDKYVQLRYHLLDNIFDYTLKQRPIIITIVEKDDGLAAQAYDPDMDRPIPISRMEYDRVAVKGDNWGLGLAITWDGRYAEGALRDNRFMFGPAIRAYKTTLSPMVGYRDGPMVGLGLVRELF